MNTPSLSQTPQGDPRLLETDLARELLASTIYARLAYAALDRTRRVLPMWFHWTGEELVFGSFAHTPKVRALRENPAVAITIDTQNPPNPPGILRTGYRELPFEPTRIAVRPTWVGLLDFQDRMPNVMAG